MTQPTYDDDILIWSEEQAATLLRRVTAGERVNNVDWENVIEAKNHPDHGWHAVDFETLEIAKYVTSNNGGCICAGVKNSTP